MSSDGDDDSIEVSGTQPHDPSQSAAVDGVEVTGTVPHRRAKYGKRTLPLVGILFAAYLMFDPSLRAHRLYHSLIADVDSGVLQDPYGQAPALVALVICQS